MPNPNVYKPPVPHQYRLNLYSFKPNPNLILGTPLDQKYYKPTLEKYNIYKKQLARTLERSYTGPQIFEKQSYEFEPRKIFKPHYQPQYYQPTYTEKQQQYVPEIGVVYSAGVRYYVPQIQYNNNIDDSENSVYEKEDVKRVPYKQNWPSDPRVL